MESLVTTHQLSRAYQQHLVLEPLDLQLHRGETIGLLGVNGAGKTTLLRLLSGDLPPSSGRVEIAGADLQRQPLAARRQLGYLPERPPLIDDLTVDEYLRLAARLRRLPRRQIDTALEQTRHACGLEQVGSRPVRNLSKGYRQRLGVAQAIIHDPAVVILDEPTDGLDPAQMEALRGLIRRLAERRCVIVSSHNLAEVEAVASRLLLLHQGRLALDQPLEPRQTEGITLQLQLDAPLAAERLAALPMVADARNLHTDLLQVELIPGAPTPQLVRAVVEQGWGITELTPGQPDLRSLFFRITQGGAA